jgi:hypothetical protein
LQNDSSSASIVSHAACAVFRRLPAKLVRMTQDADPRRELDRIHNEFVSSLTPQQRRLAAGVLTGTMCTPRQQEILHKMDPYLDGLTLEQVNRLAVYDQKLANQEEFDRGWQAGCESGERSVRIIKVVVTIGLVLMVLALLFSL